MSPMKEIVVCENAPKPLGPYAVANKVGNLVFTAGQIGLDPVTNELAIGGIEAETRQALTNLKHIVEAAGSSMDLVVKTTVFLRDMNDFPKMNNVYAGFFKEGFPARSTLQAVLPRNGAVEIEVIAALP
jgi:2-iminobutanoate/2-iminopropanoate deaminase